MLYKVLRNESCSYYHCHVFNVCCHVVLCTDIFTIKSGYFSLKEPFGNIIHVLVCVMLHSKGFPVTSSPVEH